MGVDNKLIGGGRILLKTWVLILFAMLILFYFSTAGICAPQSAAAPLPENIQIIPPGPNVDPDLAKLSGVWSGRIYFYSPVHSVEADHVLIVESVFGGTPTIIYSQGSYTGIVGGSTTTSGSLRAVNVPGLWKRIRGAWDEEKKELLVTLPSIIGGYKTVTYALDFKGDLQGKGEEKIDILSMRLKKESIPIQPLQGREVDNNEPLAPR